jgi:hypothetical protein
MFIYGSLNIQKTKICNHLLYIYDQWNNSVLICNISNIENPTYLANCSTNQKIMPIDFDVTNNTLIIANRLYGFTIFNTTDKYQPIKSYDYNDSIIDFLSVTIQGNLAYFGSNKMQIYNITDLAKPTKIAFNNAIFFVNYFYGDFELLLCLNRDYRLYIVDITIPYNPIVLVEKSFVVRVTDVIYQGNYLFVATKEHRIVILNANNKEEIVFVSEFYYQMEIRKIKLQNVLAFLYSDLHEHIAILNIANVSNPQLLANYNATSNVYAVEYYNENFFILTEDGLEVVDFSDIYSPVKIAEYSSFIGDVYTFAIANNYTYLAGPAHITVLDISNLQNILKIDEKLLSGFIGMASKIVSNRLFIAGLNPLLSIFDISTTDEVNLIGSFDISPSAGATDIEIDRYYAYLATGFGCFVINFQNTNNIHLAAQNSIISFSSVDIGTDGYLYGSADQSGIFVYDLLRIKPSNLGGLSLIYFIPLMTIANLFFLCFNHKTNNKRK